MRRLGVLLGVWVSVICGCGGGGGEVVEQEAMCDGELRSWVVAGRGRHLYLDIACSDAHSWLSGRVEFTEARLAPGYVAPSERGFRNRVVKMPRGVHLRPPAGLGSEDNRLEAVYRMTVAQARCLQQDRLFAGRYELLGRNSSSALRGVMEGCGLSLPGRVVNGGGAFGSFPGIDVEIGAEVPAEMWDRFGFAEGPAVLAPPRGGELD